MHQLTLRRFAQAAQLSVEQSKIERRIMIPQVKQWSVKTVDGRTYLVLAPTKLLAEMNFANDCGLPWFYVKSLVKSISVIRKHS